MKKRINLLLKKKDYVLRDLFFVRLRSITYILGLITLLLSVSLYILNQKEYGYILSLLSEKEQRLIELVSYKDLEQKIARIDSKGAYLKKALSNDINFDEYYPFLQLFLFAQLNSQSTNSAQLQEISLTNKQNIKLSFKVYDQDSFSALLSAVENESFLDLFNTFAIEKIETSPEVAEVTLTGMFKKL